MSKRRRVPLNGPEDPRHGTYNGYTNHGCRCDPCKATAHIHYHYKPVQYEPQPCKQCGTLYQPRRSDQQFCSPTCSNRYRYVPVPDELLKITRPVPGRVHGTQSMYVSGCRCRPCTDAGVAQSKRFSKTPKGRLIKAKHKRKRRANHKGITIIIRIKSDICGVCQEPIPPEVTYPNPLSRSVGHEPPLARCEIDGWKIVVERPEHLACNITKGTLYDYELRLPIIR